MEQTRLGKTAGDEHGDGDGNANKASRNSAEQNMIQYETFESSTENEISQNLFES